jgi:2-methylcitrate dehydratase PrpD
VAEPEEPKKAPGNAVDGQFSVYFAAAIALLEGGFTWESYRRLQDPQVVALMRRVHAYACPLDGLSARVAVLTRKGERFETEIPLAKGEPERPLSWDELLAKFRPLAEPVLGRTTEELVSLVGELEKVPDLSQLGRLLRPALS